MGRVCMLEPKGTRTSTLRPVMRTNTYKMRDLAEAGASDQTFRGRAEQTIQDWRKKTDKVWQQVDLGVFDEQERNTDSAGTNQRAFE